METLVTEAAQAARKRGFPLFPKAKNPLTRIYRDIRFSHDKTPFHTHVGAVLHGPPQMGGYGEIDIHIEPANPFVAAGFWMPERDFLRMWRERMAAKPAEFQKVVRSLAAEKVEWLDGYSLKRLPRGFERQAGGNLESFFKRQVYVVRRKFTLRDIGSRSLVEKIAEFSVSARPLLEYGWSLQYRPKRIISTTSKYFVATCPLRVSRQTVTSIPVSSETAYRQFRTACRRRCPIAGCKAPQDCCWAQCTSSLQPAARRRDPFSHRYRSRWPRERRPAHPIAHRRVRLDCYWG